MHRVVIMETTLQLNKHKTQNSHGASNAVLKVPYCAEFNVPIFSNNNLENKSTTDNSTTETDIEGVRKRYRYIIPLYNNI